jgi:NAD(P)H-hydrate repair Nnr-like enzyme with NAD(P)H-hydrate epimerase domain
MCDTTYLSRLNGVYAAIDIPNGCSFDEGTSVTGTVVEVDFTLNFPLVINVRSQRRFYFLLPDRSATPGH